MKKRLSLCAVFTALFLLFHLVTQAQTKFGNNKASINPGSVVEMESTNKGILLPRVTLTDRLIWGLAGGTPVKGMVVYSNATGANGLDTGLVIWQGQWNPLITASTADYWRLKGNTTTTPPTTVGTPVGTANFWGTTDKKNLAVGTGNITRAIFDTLGNAFGGNDNLVIQTPNAGPNANSFVWGNGNRDSATNSVIFGLRNTLGYSDGQLTYPSYQPLTSVIIGTDNHSEGFSNAVFGYYNNIEGSNSPSNLVAGAQNTISNGNSGGMLVAGLANKVINNGANPLASSANSSWGSVVFGQQDTIDLTLGSSNRSLVFGEKNKLAGTSNASLVGGFQNKTYNAGWSIVGGRENIDSASYTLIAGNHSAIASTGHSSIVAGNNNYTAGAYSAVFGDSNIDSSSYTLMTGYANYIHNGADKSVVSGDHNTLNSGSPYTTVSGFYNVVNNSAFTFVSGDNNRILNTTPYGSNAILGGGLDTIANSSQILMSGNNNRVENANNVVIGGQQNKLSGASYSAVFGAYNKDSASYTFTAGLLNTIGTGHDNSVVLGTSGTTTAARQFVVGGMSGGYNFYTNNANSLGVSLASGGASWISISDKRSKENIHDLGYGLNAVMALHPTMYNYKGQTNTSLGFIAQEVKAVVPEVVEQTNMGPDKDYLGIKYSELIPVLTKAIQEQQNIIDAQQHQIEKLIQAVNELKAGK